ncbi:hypothetical protein [Nocardioides speluncae]|uniref:hypothetical protein n=1 Tax=Nocardioides speluncae TaxID=2670337 RepID=UPI000D69CD08|nr:hypothetical protein [Nocardioides speluncae]
MDQRLERAQELYERAVFAGDADAVIAGHRQLDSVEADVALARGRLLHASYLTDRDEHPAERGLFERAIDLYAASGDGRGEAEARFWLATYHQVLHDDHDTALPLLQRAEELSVAAGDDLTRSYVLRHTAFVEQAAGRLSEARRLMSESTELRRKVGFLPGVAANLVGLAYLAAEDDDAGAAPALLDEAANVAAESGAVAVAGWVDEARTNLGL